MIGRELSSAWIHAYVLGFLPPPRSTFAAAPHPERRTPPFPRTFEDSPARTWNAPVLRSFHAEKGSVLRSLPPD